MTLRAMIGNFSRGTNPDPPNAIGGLFSKSTGARGVGNGRVVNHRFIRTERWFNYPVAPVRIVTRQSRERLVGIQKSRQILV